MPAPDHTETLHLARMLFEEARAVIIDEEDLLHHLDLTLAALEFERALGTDHGAQEAFGRSIEIARAAGNLSPWMFNGTAHLGWVAVQLSRHYGTAVHGTGALGENVLAWIEDFPEDSDIDLPRGLLGLGLFGLVHPDPGLRLRIVAESLQVIADRLETDADGVYVRLVRSPYRVAQNPDQIGQRDLGLAHGNAGLVAFLANVVTAGIDRSGRAQDMLDRSVSWLLAQRAPTFGSIFPNAVETRYEPSRSAWCYGDPGVASALRMAASVTVQPGVAELVRTTTRAVLERNPAHAGVGDASVCHGAAGLVAFGRNVRGCGPVADHYVEYWARHVGTWRAEGHLRYQHKLGEAPRREMSLLEGDLGVALALLQASTSATPTWGQRLLMVPVDTDPA